MIDELGQAGVVCRREGHEGNLIIARILDQGICDLLQSLFALLAHRAVDHPRLAETASAAAAAEHFQYGTIMHDLDMREDRLVIDVDMVDITDDVIPEKTSDGEENTASAAVSGKTFVITGAVSHFKNRDELKEKIESLGGKAAGSVSSKTDFLINNDVTSTSGKNKKAKELNIPIISEEDFL